MDKVKNFWDHSMILWEMAGNLLTNGQFVLPQSYRENYLLRSLCFTALILYNIYDLLRMNKQIVYRKNTMEEIWNYSIPLCDAGIKNNLGVSRIFPRWEEEGETRFYIIFRLQILGKNVTIRVHIIVFQFTIQSWAVERLG